MKFTKMFTVRKNAYDFAREHFGVVSIMYDWDTVKNTMIKLYVVKF